MTKVLLLILTLSLALFFSLSGCLVSTTDGDASDDTNTAKANNDKGDDDEGDDESDDESDDNEGDDESDDESDDNKGDDESDDDSAATTGACPVAGAEKHLLKGKVSITIDGKALKNVEVYANSDFRLDGCAFDENGGRWLVQSAWGGLDKEIKTETQLTLGGIMPPALSGAITSGGSSHGFLPVGMTATGGSAKVSSFDPYAGKLVAKASIDASSGAKVEIDIDATFKPYHDKAADEAAALAASCPYAAQTTNYHEMQGSFSLSKGGKDMGEYRLFVFSSPITTSTVLTIVSCPKDPNNPLSVSLSFTSTKKTISDESITFANLKPPTNTTAFLTTTFTEKPAPGTYMPKITQFTQTVGAEGTGSIDTFDADDNKFKGSVDVKLIANDEDVSMDFDLTWQ